MKLRRILLRAMLWSLAFAAVTGVFAVLVAAGDLVWRVVGTGIVTAVACGVMLPVSGLIDRERTHAAGLLGMGAIVIEYVLALALIWEIADALFVRGGEKFAGTMVLFAITVIVTMSLVRLLHEPHGRRAASVGVALTAIAFVVFMIAIWSMNARTTSLEWWETGWALVCAGALVTINLVKPQTDHRLWRSLGVAGSALAGVLWLGDIWVGRESDPGFVAFVLSMSTGAVVAVGNLTALCPLSPGQVWVRIVTVIAFVAVAALVDLIAIDAEAYRLDLNEDFMIRATSASGIIAGCGSLALCVLARINRRVDFELELGEFSAVTVICPHCRKKQSVPIGGAQCSSCGLRILVRVQEPRCPQCDYLLIGRTSERCPECGTIISNSAST